jgi:monomeric sarcosine oxidase
VWLVGGELVTQKSEIIVIGGGTMGTAAGWALARRGHEVTVLEQFDHVHAKGSHSGNTRIYRHAYAEGALYVPWALEASRLWREVQARTGTTLMVETGCLDISEPGLGRANGARASAAAFNLPVEQMTGRELNERWPVWNIPDDWEVTLDPDAGFLLVEPALRALAAELVAAGGSLRTNEPVTSWEATDAGVRVTTDQGTYEADRLIIAAGAWNSKVLAGFDIPLEVRRKPVMWFGTNDPAAFMPDTFPVFVYQDRTGEFYGLPIHQDDPLKVGGSIKLGIHSGGLIADPDQLDREWHESDIEPEFRDFLTNRMRGVEPLVTASSMCMYTMSPDQDFIIDRHPEHANVAIAAGFSGHGFKFTPKVGEHLADLVTDGQARPIPEFSLGRFQ